MQQFSKTVLWQHSDMPNADYYKFSLEDLSSAMIMYEKCLYPVP